MVGAPVSITAAEPAWLASLRSGVLPEPLFRLYEQAQFLSFGAAPRFLRDPDNLLFSYFGMLVRGLHQQLQDAADLFEVLQVANQSGYTPVKKSRGLPWDPSADRRANRAFRDILTASYATLDILAELISLVFTNRIPGLIVGRSQFASIENWLRADAAIESGYVLANQLGSLRQQLVLHIPTDGPERDWLPLLRLLRNKNAHLGDDVFRYFGLFDSQGELYLFVPRQWPYFFQMHMTPATEAVNAEPFPEFLRKTLVAQDYIAFTKGLNRKIRTVVGGTAEVLGSALDIVGGNDLNQAALTQLLANSRTFEFEGFEEV